MSISTTTNLTVKTWSEFLFDLYNTTLKNIPAPMIVSPDGEYTYSIRGFNLSSEIDRSRKEIFSKYRIKTEAEKFAYCNRLISLSEANDGSIFWGSDRLIEKSDVICTIAQLIWGYQIEFPFANLSNLFFNTKSFDMYVALLLKSNIFSGISVKSINKWLEDDTHISIADTEIIIENTKKFFSKF